MTGLVLSRPVRLADIPKAGLDIDFTASASERAALARNFDLAELNSFTARLRLERAGAGFELNGSLAARVTYRCVVTLEPFDADVGDSFVAHFAPADDRPSRRAADEIDISFDEADPPEPIIAGVADIGPLLGEFLSLALEPYPRKPDSQFAAREFGDGEPQNQFGALAKLKLKEE